MVMQDYMTLPRCSMMQVSSWPTVSTLIFHHHVTVMVSSDDPKLYQNILSNDLEFRTHSKKRIIQGWLSQQCPCCQVTRLAKSPNRPNLHSALVVQPTTLVENDDGVPSLKVS